MSSITVVYQRLGFNPFKMTTAICVFVASLLSATSWAANSADEALSDLQHQWAHIYYELDEDQQEESFDKLLDTVDSYLKQYPKNANLYAWSGIIKSTAAGTKGGLGALKLVKQAKKDLEESLEYDATALQGSAYTSLGILHLRVPGWPVAFGSNKKAKEFLDKALAINPDGIDPNYFYGQYLVEEKQFDEARKYFNKALAAKDRPNRPLADSGRREEIRLALKEIEGAGR
ncbi:tetratricopeptide repeat protein [Sessilibacter sp. MAH4]